MSNVDATDPRPHVRVRWFAVVALVGHLLLLILGAATLWRVAGRGLVGGVVTAAFVAAYFLMWRFLLAPGSRHRLGERERLTLTLTVVPVVAVLTALGELWLPGIVAGSFVLLGDALDQRRR